MAMSKTRVLSIFGSRPEAIKMTPVLAAMNAWPEHFEALVCLTCRGENLEEVLDVFQLSADFTLDAVRPELDLSATTQAVLGGVKDVLASAKPDVTLVQGDTTTTFAGSLACFYARVPVAHVEAGVRSSDKADAFPEEINRRLADCLGDLYFAPTELNRDNLLAEGCDADAVVVTGNTVIDTLQKILPRVRTTELGIPELADVDWSLKTLLFTCHRRRSYGDDVYKICEALQQIVGERSDVNVVCPVHEEVRGTVAEVLGATERCYLLDPVDYVPFVGLLDRCHFVLTDSDGIQEEAPSLDKPVLVLRDRTERPEAIEAGAVRVVGTDTARVAHAARLLLDDPEAYYDMAEARNPYGDGKAGIRIVNALHRRYSAK